MHSTHLHGLQKKLPMMCVLVIHRWCGHTQLQLENSTHLHDLQK